MEVGDNAITSKRDRDLSIDLLKAIAIFGVIIIHTCNYNLEIGSFNWTSSVFWGSIVRASVPIFFMCSGALLLSPQIAFSLKRFFSKNVLRIIVAMFVWAMAYKVFHLIVDHAFTVINIFQAIKEVLVFNQEFHLYFLQIIIIVYLFLPITRIITQYATKSQLEYLLALWFVLGIVFPTVISYWPFTLLSGIPMQYKINMTYAAIGYGLLGYYLKQYGFKNRIWYVFLAALGFLMAFFGTYIFSVNEGIMDAQFLEGMSVGVCLMAGGIFGFITSSCSVQNPKVQKAIIYISKASFCIFLTHIFFIYILSAFGITAAIMPTIFGIPLFAIVIFLCSTFVYAILSRIPVVKDWII